MKLSDFTALCFDMDFAMVNYNLDNFMPFIYQITADFLIDVKGYSNSLRLFESHEVMRYSSSLPGCYSTLSTDAPFSGSLHETRAGFGQTDPLCA